MKALPIFLCMAILLLATACSSSSGTNNNDPDTLSVIRDIYDNGAGPAELDLRGPSIPVILSLTYYIYGTDEDLGDPSAIPLQHERLDETAFGPLAFGEELNNVDLTPWDQYDYVYVRVLGALPNMGFQLEPGKSYIFRAD